MTLTSSCAVCQEWLERTPGLEEDGFNFWSKLETCIFEGLDKDRDNITVREEIKSQKKEVGEQDKVKKITHEIVIKDNSGCGGEGGNEGRVGPKEGGLHFPV